MITCADKVYLSSSARRKKKMERMDGQSGGWVIPVFMSQQSMNPMIFLRLWSLSPSIPLATPAIALPQLRRRSINQASGIRLRCQLRPITSIAIDSRSSPRLLQRRTSKMEWDGPSNPVSRTTALVRREWTQFHATKFCMFCCCPGSNFSFFFS